MKKAQTIAKHHTGEVIRDIAIAVPAHFSHPERAALLNAAKLAGLNVQTLVDQSLATAVGFAADKTFEKPKNILFFDFGGSNLQLSLFEFSNQLVRNKTVSDIKHIASDVNLDIGGQEIDRRIVELWENDVRAKGLVQGDLTPRVRMRMMEAARKAKEILSVNKEAHAFVENVSPDVDYNTVITREQMETLCKDMWKNIEVTLDNFLKKANMTVQEIDDIQLFGASTRVPIVQETIMNFYGHAPSRQLNTDESVAVGTALYAAEVSGLYRVRFKSKHGSKLGNSVSIERKAVVTGDEPDELYESTIFTEASHYGSKRILKIPTEKDSIIKLTYVNDLKTPGLSKDLGEYLVTGLEGIHKRYNVTDKIVAHYKIELTTSGTVELTSAEAHVPIIVQKTVRVKKVINETEVNGDNQEVNGGTEEVNGDNEEDKNKTVQDEEASTHSAGDEEVKNDPNEENKSEKTVKAEPKIEYENVLQESKTVKIVSLRVRRSNADEIQKVFKAKKKVFEQVENEEKERLEAETAKSLLESFIYAVRDSLEDKKLIEISTDEERAEINVVLEKTSDWLYDEGFDQPAAIYNTKLEEIGNLLKRIYERQQKAVEEEQERMKEQELLTEQLMETIEEQLKKEDQTEKPAGAPIKDEL